VKSGTPEQPPESSSANAVGSRIHHIPHLLRGMYPGHDRLQEFTLPFSNANLNRINKIANFHSAFFPGIVFYRHNNFEIRILAETFADSSPAATGQKLETLGASEIERVFLQFTAVYQAAGALGLDFISFDSFQVLSDCRIQFPITLQEKKVTRPPQPEHTFKIFTRSRHFKDLKLKEKTLGETFHRLKDRHTFQPEQAYIYRYDDFAATILNAYPLDELKSGANLKIKIKTANPIQKKIIKLNLYNTHISGSEDIFFADIGPASASGSSCGYLPHAMGALLPEEEKTGYDADTAKEDFVSIIHRLNLFLKKSSVKSMVLMIDDLAFKEDTGFINYLFDFRGISNTDFNIVLVCFDPRCDHIDFDLELNENPPNLLEKYLGFAADTGRAAAAGPGDTADAADTTDTGLMSLEEVERRAAHLVGEFQLDRARELIFNYWDRAGKNNPPQSKSTALKLTLAEIHCREKESQALVRILKEIKKDPGINKTGNAANVSQELCDHYHYLEFVRFEKESQANRADRHRKKIKSKQYRSRAAVQLSDRYIYSGDFETAQTLLEDSGDYFSRHGPLSSEIEAGCQWAKLYRYRQAFEEAEKLYRNLFIKSEMKSYGLLSADIAVDLGNLYQVRDNFKHAEVWYQKARKIYQNHRNENGIYLVTSNLAEIHKAKGNWQETKTSLESVLAYDKQKNAVIPIAIDYFNIAHLEYLKHNFTRAREFLDISISLFRKKNSITHLVECGILKQKIALMSADDGRAGDEIKIETDFFSHHDRQMTHDQEITADIFNILRDDVLKPLNSRGQSITRIIEKIPGIESRREQYEITTALISYYKAVELLDFLKQLSMILSKETKNYYYYEYYYIYYNYFFKWAPGNEKKTDTEGFTEIYYFFLKNQRSIAANIAGYKHHLDQKESRYDIFKSAKLVGDYIHWKIPEDFFNSLVNEIRKVFPAEVNAGDPVDPELVKLVIYEDIDREKPLFDFSTTQQFKTLTDEMVSVVLRTLEPLDLGPDEIKQQKIFTSTEKAFYFYRNTRALSWRISEKLFGVLILAFSRSTYGDDDFYRRYDGLLKKFAPLIHSYYERDFKLNQTLGFIIGESPAVKRMKEQILKVSKVDFPVLIKGESGSGKELVAKATHLLSSRAGKPFVAVNAAAIPENLLEAELFGCKKGAFTGAYESKVGLIEAANEGTLFLDEIADLPFNLQAKLLRVLQENEIRRLGENKTRAVNLRLIFATNKNLEELVAAHQFRGDLYFRINVLTIDAPPLRERREDIPLLVRHFLKKYGFPLRDKQELQRVIDYFYNRPGQWTGNIRELESSVMRLITYYPDFDMNTPAPWSPGPGSGPYADEAAGLMAARENLEKTMVLRALAESNWNKVEAASLLRISRQYLFTLIKRYGL
jgi:transcriptional regulator with AAA-type ATPase domain